MLTGFASRLRLPCHSIARSSLLSLYKPQESALPDALPAGCRSSHLLAALSRLLVVSLLLLGLGFCLPRAAYANPTVTQGNSATFPATGTDTPQSSWGHRAGEQHGCHFSAATNGWSVAFNTSTNRFTVGAPASAMIAANYEVRTYSSAGPKSAFFDVTAAVPPQLSTLVPCAHKRCQRQHRDGNRDAHRQRAQQRHLGDAHQHRCFRYGAGDGHGTLSGQSSATPPVVSTQGVTTTKTVTISAAYNSVTRSADAHYVAPGPLSPPCRSRPQA